MFNDWSFLLIFAEPWFWQGMVVNTSFTLALLPLTNRIVQKLFVNRKKNRIKNALNEFKIYCLQQIIKDKHINKDDFENQLYMIANRYNLDIKDIYKDTNVFKQILVHSLLEIDFIDNNTKEKIANRIRKDKLFIETETKNSQDNATIFAEEHDYNNEDNILDNNSWKIELNKNEKKDILKYTGIITGIIFVFLLIYTFLCQVLVKAYGNNSVIFINTIIIIIATIPILINGIIHMNKFNEQNKIYFCFLLLISILNIINFMCIAGILLYNR